LVGLERSLDRRHRKLDGVVLIIIVVATATVPLLTNPLELRANCGLHGVWNAWHTMQYP
jgi:hypothetical protein